MARSRFAFRLASLSCPLNATNLRRSAVCRVELELILFVSLNSITMTITRLHDCARFAGQLLLCRKKEKRLDSHDNLALPKPKQVQSQIDAG